MLAAGKYIIRQRRISYRVSDVLHADVLYADVWEGNINSIKSLESSGYKLIETKNAFFAKAGKNLRNYIFSLSKNDFQLYLRASSYYE